MNDDRYSEIERIARRTLTSELSGLNSTLTSGQSHFVIANAVAKAIAEAFKEYDERRRY